MYELFQFVRKFSLKTNNPGNHDGNVEIKRFAWREEGEKSFLALLCSNDYVLLHYNTTSQPAITKQLQWPSKEQIGAMCFDPTLTWLLLATKSIYIIPALSLVDPGATVDQLFAIDDVTIREFDHTKDSVTCAVWWQTLDQRQIAVLGTKEKGQVIKKIENIYITDLTLSHDDLLMNTSLLITPQNGNQWHCLLETRTTIQSFASDADANELGYDNIDGRTIPPRSVLDPLGTLATWNTTGKNGSAMKVLSQSMFKGTLGHLRQNFKFGIYFYCRMQWDRMQWDKIFEGGNDIFNSYQFTAFQPPTHFRPQYAKGRHFITAHSSTSSTFHVLESSSGHNELFVYQLPNDADHVILTDKLIFTTINHSRDKKLIVLSNQQCEQTKKTEEGFKPKSIMQEFLLPEDEKLLGVEVKRFPFYFHEHSETCQLKRIRTGSVIQPSKSHNVPLKADVLQVPVKRHTVLDGCIIVTSHCVYEILPRISPERLFLHLALMLPETIQAEFLAISIGLDLTSLSEVAAEYMLEQGCHAKAIKLYKLSKCSLTKRIGGLASHGCIPETTYQLKQILNESGVDIAAFDRKVMSNLLLHCFVYHLNTGRKSSGSNLTAFKDFLSSSFSFDEQMALNLLSDFKEVDLLLSLAKSRGLIMDALNLLGKAEAFANIPYSSLSDLVQKGFTAHLIHSDNLVPCLSPEHLTKLLITRPQLALQHCNYLKPLLASLNFDLLLELALIFDPSKSVMKRVLKQLYSSPKRTNSMTSLSSYASEGIDLSGESRENQSETLLEFFLAVVLYLNKQRWEKSQANLSIDFESLVADPLGVLEPYEENGSSATDSNSHLSVQVQLIAGGAKHAATIRNGQLYTWGRSSNGRLGHGDVHQPVCPPKLVETLYNLKLTVQAVACGNEHTLALTNQGLYGWGSSVYGQVGVGKTVTYCRPMFIETLQSEQIVAIACGFYHSIALTMDHQVYTWGWGIHGQLGHGNPENYTTPSHVKSLLSIPVVRISGGYAHSLVLSEDGQVFSFGCGYFGQLGCGPMMKSSLPQKVIDIPDPVRAIGTKYFHSIAVTVTNKVYMWGCHPHNLRQLASCVRQARHAGQQVSEPTSFQSPSLVDITFVHGKIIKVACGSLHTVLLTDDGGVYVWGRNLEGQLGTGSRQDERLPKMLTSLNHQHILAVDSGGEYTLVVDAEATVWLWGKNDSGQVNYSRMRKDIHSNKSRSNLYLQGSEFMTPTNMRSLPMSDPGNQAWMGLLSSLSQSCTGDELQEETPEPYRSFMPNLDLLGPMVYPSSVVPVTLKAFESVLDPSFALQRSVDLKDWICASQISCLQEDYIQALYYRLQAVSEKVKDSSLDEIADIAVRLVAHHIELLLAKPVTKGTKMRELHIVSQQALEFWQKHNFPMQELEKLFSLHMSILAPWLLKVILSTSVEAQDGELVSETTFTTLFSLKVLKLCMQPAAVLSGATDIDVSGIIDSDENARSDLRPREKLNSKDMLWSNILTNMKKDTGTISMNQSLLQRIEEQIEHVGGSHKLVVFSCGHMYLEKEYTDAVTSLTTNLSIGPNKVPQSSMLLQRLLSSPGLKPSACPKCIKQGLHASSQWDK